MELDWIKALPGGEEANFVMVSCVGAGLTGADAPQDGRRQAVRPPLLPPSIPPFADAAERPIDLNSPGQQLSFALLTNLPPSIANGRLGSCNSPAACALCPFWLCDTWKPPKKPQPCLMFICE